MTIGERIRSLMREGESTIRFAKRTGISPMTARLLLSGYTRQPRDETLQRVAKALGTTPQYLRYGIGPENIDAEREGLNE